MITVLLADDHRMVRQGVRAVLEYEPDIEVVGEAGDGAGALSLLESLHPNVLITDLSMPEHDGIELATKIKKCGWQTKVVLLSMYGDEPYVTAAFNSGASAYVLKESGVEHAVTAIREAVAGRRYVSPPLVLPAK